MKGFAGFPDGRTRLVPVPEPFFTELLPAADHLGELKVVLYAIWRLGLQPGPYAYLWREDFAEDEVFLRGLAASPRQAQALLDEALERAEARGVLLRARLGERDLYLMNTPRGREAWSRLGSGDWRPAEAQGLPASLSRMRSNVFTLYEQNIGPLTPMVAEELRDAEATYPAAWIEDAIRIAVKNNARKLKYILAVLQRMQSEGRHEQEDREDPEAYLRRYDGYRPFVDDESA